MNNLWVFGHSLCLPFNLEKSATGWVDLLAEKNNLNPLNYSQPGADNFYIYRSFLNNKKFIKENDIVIIGWSHYSRKSFVLDRNNKNQTALIDTSLVYKSNGIEFIRNNNPINGDSNKWLSMKPVERGVDYYDNWFNNYYSKYEQQSNFQSYLDSLNYNFPNYIPFFFSKESIEGIDTPQTHAGFITEFIIENKFQISKEDIHLSETGHISWANHLQSFVDECILTTCHPRHKLGEI